MSCSDCVTSLRGSTITQKVGWKSTAGNCGTVGYLLNHLVLLPSLAPLFASILSGINGTISLERLQCAVLDNQHRRLINRFAVRVERETPQNGLHVFHRCQSVTDRRSVRCFGTR